MMKVICAMVKAWALTFGCVPTVANWLSGTKSMTSASPPWSFRMRVLSSGTYSMRTSSMSGLPFQ